MTLNEALAAVRANKGVGPQSVVFLACGMQPLHLATFLQAFGALRNPSNESVVLTGLYGDLGGNVTRAAASEAHATAVVIEWSDLDPRLGLRSTGGWTNASKQDIVSSVRDRCARLSDAIRQTGKSMPVAVSGPTLALPPAGSTPPAQAFGLELELRSIVAEFLAGLTDAAGIRVVSPSHIDHLSGPGSRLDAKMELLAGFPYTISHASSLALCVSEVLWPRPPKKGLITDLDETLWSGIVGEVGSDSVCWTQDTHAQVHGLYQQMLGHLAECGVLLAVTSKNELSVVEETLKREDLLLNPRTLFPVLADWGAKSHNVAEVLRVWNIGASDVVFVDDNPMELDEVAQAFPGITCLRFRSDPNAVWQLLGQLRELFAKPVLLEEDSLRRESIRASAELRNSTGEAASAEFLKTLQGRVTVDYSLSSADKRAFELLNKTNQFNLNGARLTEAEWAKCLNDPEAVAASVAYEDKLGRLGKIAVVIGRRTGSSTLEITHWVMSCRAFSRRIEHHVLHNLITRFGLSEIVFEYRETERNKPLQEFFAAAGVENGRLDARAFEQASHELPHETLEVLAV